ncbi:MAG: 5-formyltetrahydrofolate cyclo-ligase [Sinobacteraceae bacterium]|nr:5-formyltetrahydrofolate cyclo-ligase [Nevskiaceae bacterium]
MTSPGEEEDGSGGSAPCLMHELTEDGRVVDPRELQEVTRWRKAERERLLAMRMALPAEARQAETQAICAELDRLLPAHESLLISVYWPIKGEPDLRAWMRARAAGGTRIALPVAVGLRQPLTFREWHPEARMAYGLWRIPYPAETAEVIPSVVLAPLVGFDRQGYRLGYGGGFFDRTLAQLRPRPRAIGLGYACCAIQTIHPQAHDIPMDEIVTGAGSARRPHPAQER